MFLQNITCQKCGGRAASIEITPEYFLKYSGPGGSSGIQGNKISQESASSIIDMLKEEPIDNVKLKNQFYDRAGLCPECKLFYCPKCWNISSSGFGTCPNGHGVSLDPHWSPDD
jgi:hypothetical protein